MYASKQQEARSAWVSPYPFEMKNGGLGVLLTCTGTSSRIALVGDGNALVLTNNGQSTAWLAWGDSTITATTSYFPVPAGCQITVMLPQGETPTHMAGITTGATVTVNVHRGHGV